MKLPDFWKVGARFTARVPAEPGFTFESGAFASSLGNTVPLKISGQQAGWALVVAADVAEDGSSVRFTYEITQLCPPAQDGDGMPAGTGSEDSNDTQ